MRTPMSIPLPTYTPEQQRRIEMLARRVWAAHEEPTDDWEKDQYGRRLYNRTTELARHELVRLLQPGMVAARTSMLGEMLRALGLVDAWNAAERPTFWDFTSWFRGQLARRDGGSGA